MVWRIMQRILCRNLGNKLLRNLLCLDFIVATENYVLRELSADIKLGECVCPNQTYFGVRESVLR